MPVKREIKVGIFVLIGLIVAGAIIFLIGDERRLFDKHYELHATFADVVGLKAGAPVRMGGVDVGSVTSVRFGTEPTDKRLHVLFSVVAVAHDRIRTDSIVTISNKGLLGDKMLEVSQGSDALPTIPDKGDIKSEPPDDFAKYLAKANDVLDLTKSILGNVDKLTKVAGDPAVAEDIKGSITAVRTLLSDAASHDGFAHRLLTDPKMADHLDRVFVDGAQAGRSFGQVATELQVVLRQVKDGPGIAHTLLYGKEGDALVRSLSQTSDELAATMKEIRTGKGAAHEIIYGESGQTVSQDLAAMSSDLRKVVADLRAGKGTIGALLVDPSIYEDMKTILGNVDRNQVLRALVRYTIKQDEGRPSPATQTPPSQSGVTNPPKTQVIPKP